MRRRSADRGRSGFLNKRVTNDGDGSYVLIKTRGRDA